MAVENLAGDFVEKLGFSQQGLLNSIGWILIIIILGIVFGVLVYFYGNKKKYNKSLVIWEKINNVWQITRKDVATEIVISAGETAFFCKKHKKTIPKPNIQSGPNQYWFRIDENGDWINTGVDFLDEKTGKFTAKSDQRDMRLARASLQKILKDNYKKEKWYERYAPYIAIGILVFMLGVTMWLLYGKQAEIVGKVGSQLELANQLAITQKDIMVAMDNLCTNKGIVRTGG